MGWQTSDEPLLMEGKLLLGQGHREEPGWRAGRSNGRQSSRGVRYRWGRMPATALRLDCALATDDRLFRGVPGLPVLTAQEASRPSIARPSRARGRSQFALVQESPSFKGLDGRELS